MLAGIKLPLSCTVGHVVDESCLHSTQEKIKAIQEIAETKTWKSYDPF